MSRRVEGGGDRSKHLSIEKVCRSPSIPTPPPLSLLLSLTLPAPPPLPPGIDNH